VWEPLAGDRRRRRVSVVRAVAVAAVVVVGVATAGIVAAARDGSGNPSASRPPSRPITTRPRVATTQPPRPTTSTAPAPVVETAAGNGTVTVVVPFTLMLAPTGTCWVSVTNAAGQTLFEGTLQAGQHQPVVGSGPLVIRLGNTSAMTMELNGEPLDLSGVARTANVSFVST
jgi:cytoskeleton protein RodZ